MKKDSVLDRLDAFLSRISPDELYNMLVDEYHMPTIEEEEFQEVNFAAFYEDQKKSEK